MGRKYERVKCELCDGTGQVPLQFSMMLDGFCDFCGGTGWVDDDDEFEGDIAPLPDGWEEACDGRVQ